MGSRTWIAAVSFVSALVLGAGVACAAGAVTVKYRVFPDGGNLLPPEIVKGSITDTAKENIIGGDGAKYEFLFWNEDGKLETGRKISYTPPGGTKDFLTAWYIKTGSGGQCAPNCAATTYAFSLTGDGVMTGVTPIASVTPAGLWTAPSTTVSTMTTSGPIMITARGSIVPPSPAATFDSWLPGKDASGDKFTVQPETDAEAIAFYTEPHRPPLPQPCPPPDNPHVNCHF
jgi:hypothetical protein